MTLARPPDHFRASDVTMWGVVALCCWGGAVLLSNVSPLLPAGLLAGLHASRMEGATAAQLRTQVAALSEETRRMRSENNLLVARFDRAEQADRDALRRIGALEISLPDAIEARSAPPTPGIDSMPTASIGGDRVVTFDADGGSVSVVQKPLFPARPVELSGTTETALADPAAFGVLLGFAVPADEAEARWQEIAAKVGTLLIGMVPLLQQAEDGTVRVVAGPLPAGSDADQLCQRMDLVGIPCETTPFVGEALPLLN